MKIFKEVWFLIILLSVAIAGLIIFTTEGTDDVAIKINEQVITYENFNEVMRSVQEWTGEDLTEEKLKEETIREVVYTALFDQYLESKGITVTKEEIDEKWKEVVADMGVENREEVIQKAMEDGVSEKDLNEMMERWTKEEKLMDAYREEVILTEEEIQAEYESLVSSMIEMGVEELPFEEIEEEVRESSLRRKISSLYSTDMEKMINESNIEVFFDLEKDIDEIISYQGTLEPATTEGDEL